MMKVALRLMLDRDQKDGDHESGSGDGQEDREDGDFERGGVDEKENVSCAAAAGLSLCRSCSSYTSVLLNFWLFLPFVFNLV
jgi:hypothetical protein